MFWGKEFLRPISTAHTEKEKKKTKTQTLGSDGANDESSDTPKTYFFQRINRILKTFKMNSNPHPNLVTCQFTPSSKLPPIIHICILSNCSSCCVTEWAAEHRGKCYPSSTWHELTELIVLLWLTEERECAIPQTQNTQASVLPWLLAMDYQDSNLHSPANKINVFSWKPHGIWNI